MDKKIFTDSQMKYVVLKHKDAFVLVTARCFGTNDICHEQIVYAHKKANEIEELTVCGGGRIWIDADRKEIKVFDTSNQYDSACTETVTRLVSEAMVREGCADYNLVVKDTVTADKVEEYDC